MAPKRIFCFGLTDEEKRDPKKLCSYAAKVPAVGQCSSKFEQEDLKVMRKNMQEVVNVCWRNPKILMQAVDWCEDKASEMIERGNAQMFESISTLRALDEEWAIQLLVKKYKFALPKLEKACEVDPDIWRQLFMYGMCASLSLKIPKGGKDKVVCATWIEQRMSNCCNRFSEIKNNELLNDENLINWAKLGVYSLEWNGNRCVKVRHNPTKECYTCAEHVVITKRFVIQDNWSDHSARRVCKPTTCNIAEDFFGKVPPTGPHKLSHWTAGCSAAEKAMTAAAEAVKEARGEDVTASSASEKRFLQDAKAKAKAKHMANARSALHMQMAARNNKRNINFDAWGYMLFVSVTMLVF